MLDTTVRTDQSNRGDLALTTAEVCAQSIHVQLFPDLFDASSSNLGPRMVA